MKLDHKALDSCNDLNPRSDIVSCHFQRSLDVLQRAIADQKFLSTIEAIARSVACVFKSGQKVLIAGNGGSAADAQHIAAELIVRYRVNRPALPAIALTADSSVLTAIGNDFGFEDLFARQVRGLGRPGDVFVGISTSGRSANIIRAFEAAREMGLTNVGFTGSGPGTAVMRSLCDVILAAPSDETALIQQLHLTAAHAICAMIEDTLVAASSPDGAGQ